MHLLRYRKLSYNFKNYTYTSKEINQKGFPLSDNPENSKNICLCHTLRYVKHSIQSKTFYIFNEKQINLDQLMCDPL